MSEHVRITGVTEAQERTRKQIEHEKRAIASGLYIEASKTMTRSKRDFVPVDLGTLRGSGYVTLPRVIAGLISLEMGYGGPASDYAIKQHEDLSLNHPSGGQAKYLEQPVKEDAPGWAESIQEHVERYQDVQDYGQQLQGDVPQSPTEEGGST